MKKQVFLQPGPFGQILFLYDNFPGGIGLSPALFELKTSLLQACLGTIEACPCEEGCPSCVGPVRESGEKPNRWPGKSCRDYFLQAHKSAMFSSSPITTRTSLSLITKSAPGMKSTALAPAVEWQ